MLRKIVPLLSLLTVLAFGFPTGALAGTTAYVSNFSNQWTIDAVRVNEYGGVLTPFQVAPNTGRSMYLGVVNSNTIYFWYIAADPGSTNQYPTPFAITNTGSSLTEIVGPDVGYGYGACNTNGFDQQVAPGASTGTLYIPLLVNFPNCHWLVNYLTAGEGGAAPKRDATQPHALRSKPDGSVEEVTLRYKADGSVEIVPPTE